MTICEYTNTMLCRCAERVGSRSFTHDFYIVVTLRDRTVREGQTTSLFEHFLSMSNKAH